MLNCTTLKSSDSNEISYANLTIERLNPPQKSKRNWKDRDLAHFANVKIYLRKWVSEAFAGVLGGDVLLYVWDLVSSGAIEASKAHAFVKWFYTLLI